MSKNPKKAHSFAYLLIIISLIAVIWSSYSIWIWITENINNNNLVEELRLNTSFEENDNMDFSKLLMINPDTVGWIKINNTNIDYPVVQGDDNEFYLKHSFDKSYNSSGSIFVDYNNNLDGTDKNIILYGHNRKDGNMFANIKNALDISWCENKDNQIITLYTPAGILYYQIFSSYKIPVEALYTTIKFDSTDKYLEFLKLIESRSVYNYDIELNENLPIITLSTCGTTNSNRYVIHAQQILN